MNTCPTHADDACAFPLDPFGFYPDKASAIRGLNPRGAVEPGYVLHTPYIAAPGPVLRFEGRFDGLAADGGAVSLLIHMQVPQVGMPTRVVARSRKALAAIARDGGRFSLECLGVPGASYALLARAPRTVAARARGVDVQLTVQGEAFYRIDPAISELDDRDPLAPLFDASAPTLDAPLSQMCTATQFGEPAYAHWTSAMGEAPRRHRKQWEFVFVLQTLARHGMLGAGCRGLGFGVGHEPLPAVMAAAGVDVVATDLAPDAPDAADWRETGQHMEGLEQLRRPSVCDDATLRRHVTFRTADMRDIPDDLRGFDFVWSACALEHLGSIQAGLAFIRRSVECLRPGGVAVHTTEFNLSSNDRTLDHASTVLFRRRDMEQLALELIADGHAVAPLRLDPGAERLDRHIDLPPYNADQHLKVALEAFATTSFGIVVRRDGSPN